MLMKRREPGRDGDILSDHRLQIAAFSLYGEYVVRYFLPNSIFLPCGRGLDFDISLLCENSINQSFNRY